MRASKLKSSPNYNGSFQSRRDKMGLDMKTRQKICRELYIRYQKASKKEKGRILDEYFPVLGLNRDYLAHLLSNLGRPRYAVSDGKLLKLVANEHSKKRRKIRKKAGGGRPEKYHAAFLKTLATIWVFFDFQCGKLLAPLIKGMMPYLTAEFDLTEEMQALLRSVSPATIDRKLRKVKLRSRRKGRGTTKRGSLLKSQIPIRVYFDWDERRPGFFELDTVSHCGMRTSGQYCQTLTLTDVGSTWTEVHALLNNAHRWVKQEVARTNESLPFPMRGIDSDNGGEFINYQLLEWCVQNNIKFTRGRSYHKNDNCFVEQKNGHVVRQHIGHARFEGQEAYEALSEVYRFLNPLLNYWYPSLKLIAKEKLPSGRYKKIYGKEAKTPYQRLLESPDVSDTCKAELRKRAALLNPIALKRSMDEAKKRLLKLSVMEVPLYQNKT